MKTTFRVVMVLMGVALLAGCATPVKNYRPLAIEISRPPLGEITTAHVGDAMVEQGKYFELDAILLFDEVKIISIGGSHTFLPGYYLKEGEDEKYVYLQPEPGPMGGAVEVGRGSDPFEAVAVGKKSGEFCGVTIFRQIACSKEAKYESARRTSLTSEAFQQTLIYSGRVGNKVNIGYREFSNNLARPAFNNDVEYDLDESSTIGYRGAELEIIEATNRQITYKVIRNFNQAIR